MPDTFTLRNDPDGLAVEHGGQFHYLGHWRHPRDGKFARLWQVAVGARADVATMLERLDLVRLDARLSDAAKRDDEKDLARKALRELGDRQRVISDEAAKIDAERLKLAEVPPADAAQAVVEEKMKISYTSK